MKSSTEKLYDQFTADERIKLSIAALARRDEVEIKKLISSCPKKNYLITDSDYSDKMVAFEKICDFYLCISQRCIYMRDKCLLTILLLECNTSIAKYEEKILKLEEIRENNVIELNSLYLALCKFCEVNNFNIDYVIQYTGLEILYPGEIKEITDVHLVNEKTKNEIFEKLMEIWQAY